MEWVRYANVTNNYGIKRWTLGNETDYGTSYAGDNPGATTYANDVVEFARAMKAVDPTIRIGINGISKELVPQTSWQLPKDDVDFLEVHTYPFSFGPDFAAYQDSTPELYRGSQRFGSGCDQ